MSKLLKLKANNKQGFYIYEVGGVLDLNYIGSKTRRGRVQDNGRTSPTICSENPELCRIENKEGGFEMPDGYRYRIRKLTPRECGRLMSFSEEDITAMLSVNSNSQVYKQCGNSIVTEVLCHIFRNMIDENFLTN